MASEDDVLGLEEFRLPELVQCEKPRPTEVTTELLDSWLQHSSVGQNVKALQDIQMRFTANSTDAVPTVKPEANGKELSKSKSRARKASNTSIERSTKKSSSHPSLVPMASVPLSSASTTIGSSDGANVNSSACCSPSDNQISAVLQKVLALELQQAGFDSVESRALEVFSDVAIRYLSKLAQNLRVILDRYGSLTVDTKSLWNTWLRSMNILLPELPLFAHHDVIATRQRLSAASHSGADKDPHEHSAIAALVEEHKQVLETFQQDQPVRLSRQRAQPASPPRDFSAYFDPASVDANAFQYPLDSFPHMASLPQNLDPTDPAYSYPAPYPYYGASTSSFEPDKSNFYGYVQPGALPAGSSSPIVPFPSRRDSRV